MNSYVKFTTQALSLMLLVSFSAGAMESAPKTEAEAEAQLKEALATTELEAQALKMSLEKSAKTGFMKKASDLVNQGSALVTKALDYVGDAIVAHPYRAGSAAAVVTAVAAATKPELALNTLQNAWNNKVVLASVAVPAILGWEYVKKGATWMKNNPFKTLGAAAALGLGYTKFDALKGMGSSTVAKSGKGLQWTKDNAYIPGWAKTSGSWIAWPFISGYNAVKNNKAATAMGTGLAVVGYNQYKSQKPAEAKKAEAKKPAATK